MSRGMSSGRGRNSGDRGRGSGGFDPLACYRCGVHGHLARGCPNTSAQSLTLSGGGSGPTRGSSFKSGQSGPRHGRGRGRGRQVRFGGMNVLYDAEGYEYPVDNYGQIYIPSKLNRLLPRCMRRKIKEIKN